ncbi:MAG: hypothetical protein LBT51_06305 [Fusobacteriaceae bacterium]|jgi:hypothetical protein|nr:hypothetical protein [Fusobacteriaceae bacterium]
MTNEKKIKKLKVTQIKLEKPDKNEEMLNIIRGKDKEVFISLIAKFGKLEILNNFAEFLNKRSFFSVDIYGNIKRKSLNYAFPIFSFFNDENLLAESLLELAAPEERQKIYKIDRFSNVDLEIVKINFIKTMANGNLEFAKRYGKELFLRDKNEFFKVIANFSLAGNISSLKSLMVLSFAEIIKSNEKSFNDNIFYIFMSYMCKYRDNFYENDKNYEIDMDSDADISIDELFENLDIDKKDLMKKNELEILSYLMLMKKLNIKESKFINIAKYEVEKYNEFKKDDKFSQNDKYKKMLRDLFLDAIKKI